MQFANSADVIQITGLPGMTTIDSQKLAEAAGIIEVFSSLFQSSTGLAGSGATVIVSTRDAEWLKRATAYQYRWLLAQADLHERIEATSQSQDGQSMTTTPDALMLAPLARRALKRVSWRGSRSVRVAGVGSTTTRRYDSNLDPTAGWRRM